LSKQCHNYLKQDTTASSSIYTNSTKSPSFHSDTFEIDINPMLQSLHSKADTYSVGQEVSPFTGHDSSTCSQEPVTEPYT